MTDITINDLEPYVDGEDATAEVLNRPLGKIVTELNKKVPASRKISAGTGLEGGGDLTEDRTLKVKYGSAADTAAEGNDSRITGAIQSTTESSKTVRGGLKTHLIGTTLYMRSDDTNIP